MASIFDQFSQNDTFFNTFFIMIYFYVHLKIAFQNIAKVISKFDASWHQRRRQRSFQIGVRIQHNQKEKRSIDE